MNRIVDAFKINKGSLSLEMVIVTMIMFPIFISLIIGGYAYFTISSENTNLNFKTGRYVSTTGCNITKLQSTMPLASSFNGYTIDVSDGSNSTVVQAGNSGSISISCASDSKKGDEFIVTTSLDSSQDVFIRFFGPLVVRKAIYVQEVS